MKSANGYNPLRWDCRKSGCYNAKLRPKIEVFADCFPRRIAMSDIDGTIELNGFFLFVEWKSADPRPLPVGQRLYFERLTKLSHRITVIHVAGNAETMDVSRIQVIRKGIVGDWEETNLEGLRERMKAWSKKAAGR